MASLRCTWQRLLSWRRCFHASPVQLKNSGKPRMKTLPVSQKAKKSLIGAAVLTPEAVRKRVEERRAAELADPRIGKRPHSEIHLRQLYEEIGLPMREILRRHREFASPEMLDNVKGCVLAKLEFDMRTQKSTKFAQPFQRLLKLPHSLPASLCPQHTVLAFCSDRETAQRLVSLGAVDAGGLDLLEKLEDGVYHQENFDYALCHPEFWPTLLKARKLLKDAMPQQKSQQVTEDLESALELFRFGLAAKLSHVDDLPDLASCQLPIGELDWPDYNLETNLLTIIQELSADRAKKSNFNFVRSVRVACPPSDETFLLDLDSLGASESQTARTAAAT